ncbi:MarR family winged helix-turn-helix transcriptional regulator [Limosilactobacillus gastricus]|uniref:MarR family winged helix-turn-helix transcriptional regulator n=1 Tax=Limosilactobacillus gastricus TaxID=227942 RepID=UPI0002E71D6D|nr:MarR family transcriptional regulator [Limosilactobacillus gastricus]
MNSIGSNIKYINDQMIQRMNYNLKHDNLTATQLNCLIQLDQNQRSSLESKELEKLLRVSQPTVAGIVQRLGAKGLISTLNSPEDRRVKLIQLTTAGMELIDKAKEDMQRADRELVVALTDEEQAIFATLLEKIAQSLADHHEV